jgi:hypothetical protein
VSLCAARLLRCVTCSAGCLSRLCHALLLLLLLLALLMLLKRAALPLLLPEMFGKRLFMHMYTVNILQRRILVQ